MEPLGSAAATITSTIKVINTLRETVESYHDRQRTIRRLEDQLNDLVDILESLRESIHSEYEVPRLLEKPIERCGEICEDFKKAMRRFAVTSKSGVLDWARVKFMGSDFNGFIDSIELYKSTISIGLGSINMRNTKLTREVIDKYNDLVQNTFVDLQSNLRRVEEVLSDLSGDRPEVLNASSELQEEKEATEQCLIICQSARDYIETLRDRHMGPTPRASLNTAGISRSPYEAEMALHTTLDGMRNKSAETAVLLMERLKALDSKEGAERDRERAKLQEELALGRQALELCQLVSSQASRKVHELENINIADDGDQVVITTLADLFRVRGVTAGSRTSQWVGSVSEELAQNMALYRAKNGLANQNGEHTASGNRMASFTQAGAADASRRAANQNQRKNSEQSAGSNTKTEAPLPNQMKKRNP